MQDGKDYRGMHMHKAAEIIEVKSGILNCHIEDEIIKVYPNQVVFINSNTGHRLSSDNAEVFYAQIDIDLLEEKDGNDEFAKLYAFISYTQAKPYLIFTDNKEITELLNKFKAKYYDESKASRMYIKAYLYELVAFMYSQSFIYPLAVPKEDIKKIEQIVRYIDANFKLPITLDDICAVAKYNKFTICHTFKDVTGATIFDYINFLRMRHAIEKLREREKSILEIATECGFSSATYFHRVFKNFFGCSPSAYKKLLPENTIN